LPNPAGIPGLEIPQSRIPGLEKTVRDCNPYLQRYSQEFSAKEASKDSVRYKTALVSAVAHNSLTYLNAKP